MCAENKTIEKNTLYCSECGKEKRYKIVKNGNIVCKECFERNSLIISSKLKLEKYQ